MRRRGKENRETVQAAAAVVQSGVRGNVISKSAAVAAAVAATVPVLSKACREEGWKAYNTIFARCSEQGKRTEGRCQNIQYNNMRGERWEVSEHS